MIRQYGRYARGRGARLPQALVAMVAASLLTGCGYSEILELDGQAAAAWNEIEVQLQRRAEMVPSLVETVMSYVVVDDAVVVAISDARARLAGAVRSGDLVEMEGANAELCTGLESLLATASRYPDLQANGGFQLLRSQLSETEEQITTAGRAYNEVVRHYNDYIAGFPQLVVAKVVGADRREPFAPGGETIEMPAADE